jgi:hypothetical protein
MNSIQLVDRVTAVDVGAVITEWRKVSTDFHLIALLPEAESASVALLQAICREAAVPLGGAVFPELINGSELIRSGALLLRVDAAPPPLLVEGVADSAGMQRVADQLAGYVEGNLDESEEASLFCIFDALTPNIGTHLDAWYLRLADRVRYFGVNAGSERFVSAPCVFDGERFAADAVLLQLLPDHPGACLEHGYGVPENFITATSAHGNCIAQIDWRPALDVYRELMQLQYGVAIDRGNFYTYAVHFPFGILRADGEVLVRIPVALDDNGGIICVGEIPPNSVLALLDARAASTQSAAALAQGLTDMCGSLRGKDLLLFYCAGRRMHMGAAMVAELDAIARHTAAGRLLGALSLGEIGGSRAGGYPLFHNATLVGVPWPNC